MIGFVLRNNIKGAIFDLDGTLLDTMPVLERVEIDYLVTLGGHPKPGLAHILRTLNLAELSEFYRSEYGVNASLDEIYAGRNKLLEKYYNFDALLKDCVTPVLDSLRCDDVKMCVATASDRHLVEPAMQRCGILDYFERILTCGEENTSKSNPDIYIRAAELMGTEIRETVVVEDALHAIKSAKEAGFPVIAIYDVSAEDQAEEIKAISDYYFASFEEMLGMM